MNKMRIVLILLSFFSFGSPVFAGDDIMIRGKLVDQMTAAPVIGAKVISAYAFSPAEIITDAEGKFKVSIDTDFILKEGPESGKSNTGGNWNFYADCYGYAQFSIQKNYQVLEKGKLTSAYKLALIKEVFDGKQVIKEISDENIVDIGDLLIYPMASVSIRSDIPFYHADIAMKSKSSGKDLSGPGQGGYAKEMMIGYALPLNYETSIVFSDENYGVKVKSSYYVVPKEARCKTVQLDYSSENNTSHWYIQSQNFFGKVLQWFKNLFF